MLHVPDGNVSAVALRAFDRASRSWSIWWLDGTKPHVLDTPVPGAFTGSTGVFYADDSLRGVPIRVRFLWNANPGGNPSWAQAFSDDAGETWETNWTMEFARQGLPSLQTAATFTLARLHAFDSSSN